MLLTGIPPLEEGERRVTVVRPHPWRIVRAALPLLLLVLLPLPYAALDLVAPLLRLAAFFPVFLAVLGIATLAYLVRWLLLDLWPWLGQVYVLTNRRVIVQSGLLTVQRRECSLLQVSESDYVSRGPIARLLTIGNVEVQTSGEAGVMLLRDVAQPRRLHGLIGAQARALRAEAARHRPSELPGDITQRLLAAMEGQPMPESAPTEPYRPPSPRAVRAQRRLNLLPDEAVVEVVRPHPLVLVRRLLFPSILVLLLTLATVVYGPALLPLAVGLIVLALAPWAAWRVADYLGHEYVLTTERLMELRSAPLMFEMRNVVQLSAVQDVALDIPTLFGRLMDMGDVVVELAGPGERVILRTVPRPAEFQQRIFTVMDARLRHQRESEEARLVSTLTRWFQEYHRLGQGE